jgi:hypothetical protein
MERRAPPDKEGLPRDWTSGPRGLDPSWVTWRSLVLEVAINILGYPFKEGVTDSKGSPRILMATSKTKNTEIPNRCNNRVCISMNGSPLWWGTMKSNDDLLIYRPYCYIGLVFHYSTRLLQESCSRTPYGVLDSSFHLPTPPFGGSIPLWRRGIGKMERRAPRDRTSGAGGSNPCQTHLRWVCDDFQTHHTSILPLVVLRCDGFPSISYKDMLGNGLAVVSNQ